MPTQFFNQNGTVLCIHEPGNATRYVGAAFKAPPDSPYAGEWIVSLPEFGASYFFREGVNIHWSYVGEKLGMKRTGEKLPKVDISEVTKMIAMMVPRCTATTITDSSGHLYEGENYA